VCELARVLPTCIFGDVLQGIFDFGDATVDWNTEVLRDFPLVAELVTPWRWNQVGAGALGQWLLGVRPTLLSGGKIDLNSAPPELEWVPIAGDQDFEKILAATHGMPKGIESSLIICSSRNRQRQQQIAQKTKGASVVENADLTDLVAFAGRFDFSAASATSDLLREAASILRGISATEVIARLTSLKAGTNRKTATDAETAALAFDANKTPQKAAALLSALSNQSGVSAFRGEVFRNLLKALHSSESAGDFSEMVLKAREERRFLRIPGSSGQ
jgi:DNA helicase-2/ATP-dependent DNA helicase PcrA